MTSFLPWAADGAASGRNLTDRKLLKELIWPSPEARKAKDVEQREEDRGREEEGLGVKEGLKGK